jgi:hypothetical protein
MVFLSATLAGSLLFAMTEVRRRLGHNPRELINRTVKVFGWGALYALGASCFHLGLKIWLRRPPSVAVSWTYRLPAVKYCWLVASIALLIGFAAQLFWREKATSEPL